MTGTRRPWQLWVGAPSDPYVLYVYASFVHRDRAIEKGRRILSEVRPTGLYFSPSVAKVIHRDGTIAWRGVRDHYSDDLRHRKATPPYEIIETVR